MIHKFFVPCHFLVNSVLFPPMPSTGYVKKHWNRALKAVLVCEQVAQEAVKQGVDPLLAISVAARETRFRDVTSTKGARGPLGVIPKYHCDNPKKCNYTKAGVSALKKYLELNKGDTCTALAQYNRGNEGKCASGRSEASYASDVLNYYELTCLVAQDLCSEC